MRAELRRKAMGFCIALLLAVIPAAVTGQSGGAAPARETRDRLQSRMARLVAAPMAVVENDGLPAGNASFERLLAAARARHGARSAAVADLLESFGVGVYSLGQRRGNRQLSEGSLPYLEAAISAYRAAFGDAHPEVAVALNSYADAQLALHEDNPPQSADRAYEEAYRIRLAALGPSNVETLASLRYLLRVRGLPSQLDGNRARIAAVAGLFRQLIAQSPGNSAARHESAPYARMALARMYAQNGLGAEAREEMRLAVEQVKGWAREDQCLFAYETTAVEHILAAKAAGAPGAALPALETFACT